MKIPLENRMYDKLMEMIDNERKLCQDKGVQQCIEARQYGKAYEQKFADQDVVKQFLTNMKFLVDNQLLEDIDKKYAEFYQFIQDMEKESE